MSERTVVGWDGSEPAGAAREWVAARERDRRLDLMYVVGNDRVSLDYLAIGAKLAKAQNRVDAEAIRVRREEPTVTMKAQVKWRDPFDELCASPREAMDP